MLVVCISLRKPIDEIARLSTGMSLCRSVLALPEQDCCGAVRRVYGGEADGLWEPSRFLHADVVRCDNMGHHTLQLVRCEEASRAKSLLQCADFQQLLGENSPSVLSEPERKVPHARIDHLVLHALAILVAQAGETPWIEGVRVSVVPALAVCCYLRGRNVAALGDKRSIREGVVLERHAGKEHCELVSLRSALFIR